MVYHPVLAASSLLEKYNITVDTESKEQNIEANISARERNYLSVPKWGRKFEVQATEERTKKDYIIRMEIYPQDLPGVMKLFDNYNI